jgi:hypothetical protein
MLTPRREGRKWIVRFDPDFDPDEGGMEFRLTYEGPLRASNGGRDTRPARKDHKHTIRKAFHEQLKVLWETTPFLKRGTSGGPNLLSLRSDYKKPPTTAEELAAAHAHYGFNFVPLVTEELGLMCSLDILYLRRAKPGDVLQFTGDIDNRLKTLFDTLQIPDANNRYSDRVPADDERPFFVLLENDKLITKVSVETDRLLQGVSNPDGDTENDARLVITVRIRPYEMHPDNIQFG